jgi:hypothetical protein
LIQHTLTLMSHLRYLLHALLVMYCLLTLYWLTCKFLQLMFLESRSSSCRKPTPESPYT